MEAELNANATSHRLACLRYSCGKKVQQFPFAVKKLFEQETSKGVAQDGPPALSVLREGRMVTTSKDADARRTQRLTTAVFAVCYPTEVNVGAEDATPPFPPATC